MLKTTFRKILLATCVGLTLAACSDAEVTSPGENSQVDNGGNSGGNNGGNNGGGQTGTCPAGTTTEPTVGNNTTCGISGVLTSNLTLTSGVIYQLKGRVDVGADVGAAGNKAGGQSVTLTIQPGVRVFGAGTTDFLVVNRGSRLVADGTATLPIVFTSRQDILGQATATSRGQWGGIVMLGRAPINSCPGPGGGVTCEAQVEGTTAFFGGDQANDNSGTLRYVQIKHSGVEITPANELQALTIAGVGAGTTIDYVQAHNSSDDGIEWFGGTVNLKHIVITGASDDSLDWSGGWNGNLQFSIVLQATDEGDRVLELDNLPSDNLKTPLTNPKIANFTFVGQPNAPHTPAILERVGVGGTYVNGVVKGSPQCLDIDDASTLQSPHVYQSLLLNCTTGPFAEDSNVTSAQIATVFNAAGNTNNTTNVPDTLTGTFINGATETARTAVNPTTLGSFFSSTTWIGAVRDANDTWWQGWTCGLGSPTPAC